MRKNPAMNAVVRAPRARARSSAALPNAVAKRISRFAQSQALQYEQLLRGKVTSRVEALADSGTRLVVEVLYTKFQLEIFLLIYQELLFWRRNCFNESTINKWITYMNIKTLLACAAAVFSLSSATAQASEIWTLTSHGTIASGYDCPYYSIDPDSPYVGTCPGLFGSPKISLAGAEYTISITTDFDKDKWSVYQATTDYQMLLGTGPGFKAVVTVDGHSVTFSADQTSEGQLFMSPVGAPEKAGGAYVIGRTASDEYVEVFSGGFTYWGRTAGGLYNEVKFSGNATTTEAQRAEVPEPASLGLLALGGLAALGARRKDRRPQKRSVGRASPSA